MTTTLLIPTWNEIEGMKAIMPRVKREWVDQILVLDGGSTDGTIEYAKSRGYEVYIQKRRGLRHGYREVWPLIRGDVVITFAPDGNSIPEKIPELVAKMREGYDLVIVSRYLDGAKSEDDDVITAFGNWMFTTLVNVLHGGSYTDVMGIYRAYRTSLVSELGLNREEDYRIPELLSFARGVSWEPLQAVRAARRKLKIAEIPGDEPPRIGGKRKMKVIRWGLFVLFQIFGELLRRRESMAMITHDDLGVIRERYKKEKIVFCSGVFDLTHAGHVLFFEDCKRYGDILVVAIGHDAMIRHLKGASRPVLNEHVRLKMVDALKPVDYVLLDNIPPGENPLKTLDIVFPLLHPDVYVINDDAFDIPYRRSVADHFGVELVILPRSCPPEFENISTTKIVEKIRKTVA